MCWASRLASIPFAQGRRPAPDHEVSRGHAWAASAVGGVVTEMQHTAPMTHDSSTKRTGTERAFRRLMTSSTTSRCWTNGTIDIATSSSSAATWTRCPDMHRMRREQGPGLRQPGLAGNNDQPRRRSAGAAVSAATATPISCAGWSPSCSRSSPASRPEQILAADPIAPVRSAGPARTSYAAAFERVSLHGRAHPRRRSAGAVEPASTLRN